MTGGMEWANPRFIEFYAFLDTTGVPPEDASPVTPLEEPDLVVPVEDLESLAAGMEVALRGLEGERLVDSLAGRIKENPRTFLVLAHLYRQKKFTAGELASFFFDGQRTQDIAYFRQLEAIDPEFRKVASRTRRTDWLDRPTTAAQPVVELAAYKKALASYLGSELKSWPLWKARIENDPGVRRRISEYVVHHEKFGAALKSGALVELLRHTLRASSSEDTKIDVGELGASRLEGAIRAAGFTRPSCGHQKHSEIEDLESCAVQTPATLWYEREVHSSEFDRRFDFALANSLGVKLVIETNYYSSAGSKIDKTVKDFQSLEPRVRSRHPLLYVTDGIGWLGLFSLLKVLVSVDNSRSELEIPFYYNLWQFRAFLPKLVSRLAVSSSSA